MQTRQPPVPPLLVLAFGILAVSTASIFIKMAQTEAPSLVIAACRLILATLVLAPLALTQKRVELASLTRREWLLALLSGVLLALHFATWISSLEAASVASSVVLVSTAPLWVALLAHFILKEKLSRTVLVGMGLALLGGAVVGLSDACTWGTQGLVCPGAAEFLRGDAFLADVLALIGAITAAGYLIIGRSLRVRVSLLSYIFVVYGMAAIVLVGMMFIAGQSPLGYSPTIYLWFALLALLPQLVGHSTYNWALGYLPTAYVSIALLGEPIGSAVLAYIFLAEAPTPLKLVGAVFILAGIFVASQKGNTNG